MKNKLLAILGTGLLLVACETTETDLQSINVSQGPVPGSAEDFKTHIKDKVYFGFNKSKLTDDAHKTLDAQAGWFATYTGATATIEGNCDSRGSKEYNQALGHKRAEAARTYLVGKGVDGSRLKTISYGKERATDNHAESRNATTAIN